ncbi:phenoloxidase-activating factor 2 isoform X1 [Lasioglossum baleicum]|uniref:phenoloxidase-activating factor 2 isoform X1 n=1 Tax=Lasioglossum baleicum TaxID=434251 RepID=UPI003FCD00F9
MWKAFLTLALASYCLAAPQQEQGPGLDVLISSVFTPPPSSEQQGRTTPDNKESGGSLDALISDYQSSTIPTTYLGTQNSPKPPPTDCECIVYYLCNNKTVIVDGYGLIDIRSDFGANSTSPDQKSGGECTDYFDVCCKPPDKVEPGHQVTPPRVERKGCGQRNPDGVGFRITGDKNNETKFGEFPWMVAIIKDEIIGDGKESLPIYQCGGSLIHKQAVLTAAHCVHGKEPSTLKIRAGEWDTQTRNEIYPHQDRIAQKVIVHDKYYPGALYYDFAILILSEPVELAENVDVVCLPDPNVIYDGSRCFASGWGKDRFGKDGHYQVILKKVDLPVVPRDTCQASLRGTRLGKYFQLHESFICAGGEPGKDTCKGDGGSPLVCPSRKDPTRYQQAGIVAWGIGCGEDATPGVYANVAYVREWIDNQMAYHNLDNTVYNL